MSRSKITMKAPEGATESNIGGTYYWPDENGEIETTNVDHVELLKRHGYTVTGEVSIMRPSLTMGLMDVDEMGREQLAVALSQRGLSYPLNSSRAELAEVAIGWNQARRGRQRDENAGAVAVGVTDALATASRAELEAALARMSGGTAAAPAPAPQASAPAPAPETTSAAPAGVAIPDFKTFSNSDLKGWLAARQVDYRGNASTVVLAELAEKHFREKILPARVAEASAQAA